MLPQLRVCCTGSIGIIAIPQLLLTLRLAYRTDITCILTPSARRFITEHTFTAITGRNVTTELTEHDLLSQSDIPLLIAPASAGALAAMALGRADHLAARLVMSSTSPVFICPAMNAVMWDKPPITRAISSLRDCGYFIIGPGEGVEVETLSPSKSSLADADTIVRTLIAELPWSQRSSQG